MKLLIIGSNGLLGAELVNQARKNPILEISTSDVSDENGIDITNEESVDQKFKEVDPDFVINCAAFTNVDAIEDTAWDIALKVNGKGPGILAKYCKEYKSGFLHISTDYVFGDNKQEGYEENYSSFKPLNKYAETKLIGEENVIKEFGGVTNSEFNIQEPKAYIVRTSWLFGQGATNFISKIIELAKTRDSLSVVTDEISSPTFVKDLSETLLYIATNKPSGGIYHVSGLGHCSRYDFAKKILKTAGIDTPIEKTTLEQFERKTKIANYSYLINTKLPPMRKWEDMVEDFIKNYGI